MPSRIPELLTRHRRVSKIVIAAAALTGLGTGATAASAAGPSTLRAAAHHNVHKNAPKTPVVHRSPAHKSTGTDGDNVQSGDQTTPDTTADAEQSDGPDTDNIQSGPQSGDQSGDQSGPETPDSGGNR